jgi:hypothetical protein
MTKARRNKQSIDSLDLLVLHLTSSLIYRFVKQS